MSAKPMRVFYDELSERMYAFDRYYHDDQGRIRVTGRKHDVTEDVHRIFHELLSSGAAPTQTKDDQ